MVSGTVAGQPRPGAFTTVTASTSVSPTLLTGTYSIGGTPSLTVALASSGGSLSGSFAGTPTWSGAHLWSAAAMAMTIRQTGSQVTGPFLHLDSYLSNGSDYSGGITFGQDAAATINAKIAMKEYATDKYGLGFLTNDGATLAEKMWLSGDGLLGWRNSNVVTGLSTAPQQIVETSQYASAAIWASSTGGLLLQALGENAAVATNAGISSYGGQAGTTHTTAGRALIEFYAAQHNGANVLANITANGLVGCWRGRVGGADLSLWCVDADGDSWQAGDVTMGAVSSLVRIIHAGTGRAVLSADDIASGGFDPEITLGNVTDETSVTGASGLIFRDAGTRPACSVDNRGSVFYDAGAGGALDSLAVCRKDAADVYAWTVLF